MDTGWARWFSTSTAPWAVVPGTPSRTTAATDAAPAEEEPADASPEPPLELSAARVPLASAAANPRPDAAGVDDDPAVRTVGENDGSVIVGNLGSVVAEYRPNASESSRT